MYNLDSVVKMYFMSVPVGKIIKGEIQYKDFPEHEFARLSMDTMPQYSDTENQQLYCYIADSARQEGHPFAGMDSRSGLNVFAALEELAEQLLILEDDEVLCIYGNLLRLREVTRCVEEDLLVCAYLAMHFKRFGKIHSDFGWNSAIGHNNVQLNRIMGRGISENHFHLYGSAPAFQLMWIHFMNHVDDESLFELSKEVERKPRMVRKYYGLGFEEKSVAVYVLKAALMRVQIIKYLLQREAKEVGAEEFRLWEKEINVESLLDGEEDIQAYYLEIQKMIDHIKNIAVLMGMGDLFDYALLRVENVREAQVEHYYYAGERWIEYRMLVAELNGEAEKRDAEIYFRWFYAYLVLKHNFRSEVLQVNDTVGFENFSIYNKRKSVYTDRGKMEETAVYGSVEKGNIQSLEIRISPHEQPEENAKMLDELDGVIQERINSFPKEKYYYVFHFSKKADGDIGKREYFGGYYCRHYQKRQQLEEQAYAIKALRDNYQEEAARVLGIDACAQEIGCRPEVFAPIFRLLSNHVVKNIVGMEQIEVKQLRMTYHVGEDFLDVVDGLRAVDEAVRFLNLRCGDRIGHGTVLGIDVKKWYKFKRYTIVLSKQDYLDNAVWLYHKLTEYKLDGFDSLRMELGKIFERYFAEIYLHFGDGTIRETVHSNIYDYYEAWKLRGDDPILYQNGHYGRWKIHDRDWLVNRQYPEHAENRERLEVSRLYHLYHYDWDVRTNGKKSIQVYVPPMYVEGVYMVQKAMQKEFSSLGIGMESNPSSNLAISTIEGYDAHPIAVVYNKDITWDREQIQNCPQIYISINTDDKGVFHTSLENEYALMACAMEKKRDEEGRPLYNRQMVYQWIDNIREMGNLQSFMDTNNLHHLQKERQAYEKDIFYIKERKEG